jgi:hypothetical protein
MLPVSTQGGTLLGWAGEPELVGLAVHREQLGSDVAEHGHRYRRSAGESPGSPARGDGAPEHERVVGVELTAGVGHAPGRDGLRLEEQAAVDDR